MIKKEFQCYPRVGQPNRLDVRDTPDLIGLREFGELEISSSITTLGDFIAKLGIERSEEYIFTRGHQKRRADPKDSNKACPTPSNPPVSSIVFKAFVCSSAVRHRTAPITGTNAFFSCNVLALR